MNVRHLHRHLAWAIGTVALLAVLFTRESLPIWVPLALLALCPLAVLLLMREARGSDQRLPERQPAEAPAGKARTAPHHDGTGRRRGLGAGRRGGGSGR
ncbi:MAG TPA: hypothetical protein VFN07_12905 [Trueperaceae bacterium]|nr:hypothetical protein [Trueperaceae bacterium]